MASRSKPGVPPPHGTIARRVSKQFGCKCDECLTAAREYYRAKHKEAAQREGAGTPRPNRRKVKDPPPPVNTIAFMAMAEQLHRAREERRGQAS